MEVFAIDQFTYSRIAPVDVYESFIWATRYNKIGSFNLQCKVDYFQTLQVGRFIEYSVDDYHTCIIEDIEKTQDENGKDFLIVQGRTIEAIFEGRYVDGERYDDMEPADIIASILNKNCINPTDPRRKIPGLSIGELARAPLGRVSYTGTGTTVLKAIETLCQGAQLGFRLYIKEEESTRERGLAFDVYKGVNRTEEDNTETEVQTINVANLLENGQFAGSAGWKISGNAGWGARDRPNMEPSNIPPLGLMISEGIVTKRRNYVDRSNWPGLDPEAWIVWNASPVLSQNINLSANHIYYMAIEVENNSDSVIGFGIDGMLQAARANWVRLEALYVPPESRAYTFHAGIGELAEYDLPPLTMSQHVSWRSAILVDMTETFGVGNEPGLEYMSNNVYFDGSVWRYKRQVIHFIPNTNAPLIFSKNRDTLETMEYRINTMNERNVFRLQGEGGVIETIDLGKSGILRKEVPIDLSSIKRSIGGVTFPEPAYRAMLIREGTAISRQLVVSEQVTGRYYPLSNKRYREHFDLGDLVNCVDSDTSVETSLRVVGAIEVYDTNGSQLYPELGEEVPDIFETMRLVSKGAK